MKDGNKDNQTNAARIAAREAARKHLGLETLEDRKRDALDFHDVSVASLRAIIDLAFDAGFAAANATPVQPTEPDEILATLKITKTTKRDATGTWAEGTIAGHKFEALVFEGHAAVPGYEMGDSRISKFWLDANGIVAASFDRGWEIEPTTAIAKTITDLLAAGLAETVFGK